MKIVDGKPYIADISELIKEYYQRLGRDLSFQNIDDELKNPAKKYIRSETIDFQAGEVETSRGNLFYPGWRSSLQIIKTEPTAVAQAEDE